MGFEAEGSGPSPAVLHLISADTSAWRAEGFRFGTTFRFDLDGADRQVRTYTAAVLFFFWPSVPRSVAVRGPGGALGPGRVSGDYGPPGHVSGRSGSRTITTALALLAPTF